MGTNSTRGTPNRVSEGEHRTFYSGNFGATRRGGVPVEATAATWNLSAGRARSKAYFPAGYSQGGAHAQVGRLIKIDGNPSEDLRVSFDVTYAGFGQTMGTGSANLMFQALVIADSGPLFPQPGHSSILDRRVFVNRNYGTWENGFVSGSPNPTLFVPSSRLFNGRVLRLVIACTTIAESSAFGSAEADAWGQSTNLNHRIFFRSINLGWG